MLLPETLSILSKNSIFIALKPINGGRSPPSATILQQKLWQVSESVVVDGTAVGSGVEVLGPAANTNTIRAYGRRLADCWTNER